MRCAEFPVRSSRGFTIIELLLAVSIMTVIIISLYSVFDQTQRALRGTIAQVDVLEGVRSASDIVTRELEGAAFVPLARYTNFSVARSPLSASVTLSNLTGGILMNTVLQDVFFHKRFGENWSALGYWVGPRVTNGVDLFDMSRTPTLTVGRLYRYEASLTRAQVRDLGTKPADLNLNERNRLLGEFENLSLPFRLQRSAPVLDGVVHFRVIAFTQAGTPIYYGRNERGVPYMQALLDDYNNDRSKGLISPDAYLSSRFEAIPGESVYSRFSDLSYPTAPAALELELGVLEPPVLVQYASIAEGQPDAAAAFLARNAAKIHMFRQRITLRNASPF
ncbi:MAG: prepilin-type N-terminal cleavage/methylation domain-containing protein [Verrucomicrobiales bacterium]|nr:prepilin-type N-terminal cleavage/methylation domain-containing protein [Verrucomicrobiales bacterium]